MVLADLHIHSTYSDGTLTIEQIVDLYGQQGFGAIAITDHICEKNTLMGKAAAWLNRTLTPDRFQKYLDTVHEEAERAWNKYRMVVLPGFELSQNYLSNHRSAHILGIDVKTYVDAGGDSAELIKSIKSQDALAIAAHPVDTKVREKQTYHLWSRRQELSSLVDAWEVASGSKIFQEVLQSGLPMIANSDLHKPSQFNAWRTVIDSKRHPEAIKDAIRTQQLTFKFVEFCDRKVKSFLYGLNQRPA